MNHTYNTAAPKKPTSVSINSDLREQALAEQLRGAQCAKWLSENKDAIAAYNQFFETKGTFSDSVRKF